MNLTIFYIFKTKVRTYSQLVAFGIVQASEWHQEWFFRLKTSGQISGHHLTYEDQSETAVVGGGGVTVILQI